MELLTSLFANLALVAVLFMFAKWFIGYDMRWWLRVQRGKTASSTMKKWVFLKIKLPKEVFKTPAAMETVLLTLNQSLGHKPMPVFPKISFTPFTKEKDDGHGGKKKVFSFRLFTYHHNLEKGEKVIQRWEYINVARENFFYKYLSGSLRSWSSLEIVSDAGEIYFLLVTKANNKEIFRQYAYSQFPGIEIIELDEDPLNKFHYTNQKTGDTQLYVGRYKTEGDKDHLPIKTYVDYGLDKEMVKDEFKIDPLVVLLENMAQAKKGEMFWFQIMIRPTIYKKTEDLSAHPYDWKEATQKKIDELMLATPIKKTDEHGKETTLSVKDYKRSMLNLSLTEKHMVEIMQKNLEKPAFDCSVRMFYWVDKKVNPKGMDLPRGIMTVVNATKPFNKPNYNSFGFETLTKDTDTPYLDKTGEWSEALRGFFWKMSKLRANFYQEAVTVEFAWSMFPSMWKKYRMTGYNWDRVKGAWGEIKEYWLGPGHYLHRGDHEDFVLNLEELATLWHFPGKAFGNTESKVAAVKADPPSNLPI
jgi:hypothetical protein